MPDINTILNTALEDAKALGATLFKNFAQQAAADANAFFQESRAGIIRAYELRVRDLITDDDLEDLILGKRDLAIMHALKQEGLATAAVDTFTHGILNILMNAVFSAIKIPLAAPLA
jgi:hypothetical protein